MSSSHILYIAIVLFLGVVIGFVLGRQAATREASDAALRLERRQQRVQALKTGLVSGRETVPNNDSDSSDGES